MMHGIRRIALAKMAAILVLSNCTMILVNAAQALANDGTPHNGPHLIPGTIRAVDFNDGGSLVGYYAATAGNQASYNGYRPESDVDIDLAPSGPFVISSNVPPGYPYDGRVRDWLMYTIDVSQPHWYSFVLYLKVLSPATQGSVTILVDDRPVQAVGIQAGGSFTPQTTWPIYIRSGRHVLGIMLCGPLIAFDRVEISVTYDVAPLSPRIVNPSSQEGEVVIADAVATDSDFRADPTGQRDCTAAINDALARVYAWGGGTVYLPEGIYRVDGQISIPPNTTLRGADAEFSSSPKSARTLLKTSYARGNEGAGSFIYLWGNACVRNMAIWYPDQGYNSQTIVPYPFAIELSALGNALNIVLFNAYNGIYVKNGSAHTLGHVAGTVLKRGIVAGNDYDYSWMYDVTFNNNIWKNASRDLITNAPVTDQDRSALDAYTLVNLTGIQVGANDGYEIYGVSVRDAYRDILLQQLPSDSWPFYGLMSKLSARIEEVDGYRMHDLHYTNTDKIPEASSISYTLATLRGPAKRNILLNVMDVAFGASGDGLSDDTAQIQRALDQAGVLGGGIVYLPQGQYKVIRLSVPSGVELRGPSGADNHGDYDLETCTLLGYGGKNTAAPSADPALITLAAGSGIRGFNIYYPEQGYGTEDRPVVPYPFAIRGTGSDVWVVNITVKNPFNLIDFATFRCDRHLVMGTRATVLNSGIVIGGGSTGGVLERIEISWGIWYESFRMTGPLQYGVKPLNTYVSQRAESFVFGRCTQEQVYGADSFDVRVGFHTLADGSGCTDSTFWHVSSDTSSGPGFLFEGGDNLRFIGLASGTCPDDWLVSNSSFTGQIDIYGTMTWSNLKPRALAGGTIHFFNERGLASGKNATASSFADNGSDPSLAVDGSEFTKWMSRGSGENWIAVDLDQPSEITRWIVRHAGINGEPDEQDTSDFDLQVSADGVTYSTVDPVRSNWMRLTDRPVSARGRYARLRITNGTRSGDGKARIYEFEVHGREGWQFTGDVEGWTAHSDVASMTTSDGRLNIASSGSNPTIMSPDYLNIDTSRFIQVVVRMTNTGPPTAAKLDFITQDDPVYDQAKSVSLNPVLSSPRDLTYTFAVVDNALWKGRLRQLRLSPIQGPGAVSIDAVWLEEPKSSIDLSVAAGGAVAAATLGSKGDLHVGYANLGDKTGPAPYATAVFSLTQNETVVTEAGVPASPPTTSARIFIEYRSAAAAIPGRIDAGTVDSNTGIAVVNSGSAPANLAYMLRDIAGATLSIGHGTLAAGAHFAKFIDQLKDVAADFVLPANFQIATRFASLEIASDRPVSILALRMTTNQRNEVLFTTTPTADLTKPATNGVVFFPQFVDGGGYTTSLVLLNTSNGIETGTLQILDDNGDPLVVNQAGGTADSSFRYSIPSSGALHFQTDGFPATTKAGWARLTPDAGTSTPVGAGVFGYNRGSVLVTESGIPAAVSTTHALIHVDLSGGHNTGLAIANPTNTNASITIKAFQNDGVSGIGTSQSPLLLVSNGHSAKFADQLITGLPAGFTGVLDITSATPFAALALRSLNNERKDFLLATLPIADMTRSAPAPIVFPQIADGGGYVTQFVLLSAGGASSSTLNFYGDDGSPVAVGK